MKTGNTILKHLDNEYNIDHNRIAVCEGAAGAVREVMVKYDVPVIQIDGPMMEKAIAHGM